MDPKPTKEPPPRKRPGEQKDDEAAAEAAAKEPAAERGERIATGKDIARGGKKDGDVPGATPDE
jgi:hypothetical protein